LRPKQVDAKQVEAKEVQSRQADAKQVVVKVEVKQVEAKQVHAKEAEARVEASSCERSWSESCIYLVWKTQCADNVMQSWCDAKLMRCKDARVKLMQEQAKAN
jgi:hypothetical protein